MSKKESIEDLRKICQTKTNEPFLTPFVRKGSIYITSVLIRTPISANQITFTTILIALLAGWFLTLGEHWYSMLAGLLLQLIIVLDHVDGEVARYRRFKNHGSDDSSGKFVENIQHIIEMPSIFVGVAYGIFNALGYMWVFALCFSALCFFLAFRVISLYVDAICRIDEVGFVSEASIWTRIPEFKRGIEHLSIFQRLYRSEHLREAVFTIFRSEFLDILVLLAAVANQLWVVLFLHGILFPPLVVAYTLVSYRQLRHARARPLLASLTGSVAYPP